MVRRAAKVCSTGGCPQLVPAGSGSRCPDCTTQADHRRGSARERGYDHRHEARFRRRVLARDPICVVCRRDVAVHADHWPADRQQLVLRGEDPYDPKHGRGLCARCHSKHTADAQPGGWNAR